MWIAESSSIACTSRWPPTSAKSIARQTTITPVVASGPAAEMMKSSFGVAGSRVISVSPPNM